MGVTDFEELFDFCRRNDIQLIRNTDIHLKVIQNERNEIILGSANLTRKGLGIKNGNLEMSSVIYETTTQDLVYLESIIQQGQVVDQDLFDYLKHRIRELEKKPIQIPEIIEHTPNSERSREFLLSDLPMTESPEFLWKIYSVQDSQKFNLIDLRCAVYDLARFNIPTGLCRKDFFAKIKTGINGTALIVALKEKIIQSERHSIGYTQIILWLITNVKDTPTPTKFSIKDERWVNRLHEWIPFFDSRFISEKRHPFGSDILWYQPKETIKSLKDLIESLRIDSARGKKAPHQFILLASIYELIQVNEINEIDTQNVYAIFREIWQQNKSQFSHTRKPNFAMPINAMKRAGLIEFAFREPHEYIMNHRSEPEILEKVLSIKVSDRLMTVLTEGVKSKNDILLYYQKLTK
jgi:hypothetical protein